MPATLPNQNMFPTRVLHLEAGLIKDRVRISLAAQRNGETQTVRQVEEFSVSMAQIDRRCAHLLDSLNQVNRRGRLPTDILERLAELGQLFRDELFSNTIKERLSQDRAEDLILTLDDQLVHIPWELLHDGRQFLGQRYAMGRVVRTRQPVMGNPLRTLSHPMEMLVLADPCGDLNAAYEEGIQIRNLTESRPDHVRVTFRSSGVKRGFIKAKLRQYDLIHFAGHADFDDHDPQENGWRLGNGRLTADDILRMTGTGSMPAMVFANACQSARSGPRTGRHEIQSRFFDMANAFLLSGVKHYLGTFWEIPDEQSRHFALSFYDALLSGSSIGAAVLAARRNIIRQFGEESIVWAGYLLYGDPATVYCQPLARGKGRERGRAAPLDEPAPGEGDTALHVRGPEERIHLRDRRDGPIRRYWRWTAALLLLAVAAGFWWAGHIFRTDDDHAQKALAAFRAGQYDRVQAIGEQMQRREPDRSLGYLLSANVYLLQGDLTRAQEFYRQTLNAGDGPSMEKAEAYVGLGRIASIRGSDAKALDFYQKAARMAPEDARSLVAQGVVKARLGHAEQAVELLQRASPMAGDTKTIAALALQLQARASLAADRERQARIDRMIQDLVERMEKGEPPPSDRSAPPRDAGGVTVWLNDLETVGYTLQEGTPTLIASGLMERLLDTGRIRIVERALMEGLMRELQLGTSRLVDAQTRLRLGRLTAARLIVTGRVVHQAPAMQVTLRCIETETGQVSAVVNAHFARPASMDTIVEHLFNELFSKLDARYLS